MRPTDRLNEALRQFIARKTHLAVVKDETGRVLGLLTLEDVLDELVGEIEDDLDAGAIDLVAAGPGRWKVGGAVTLGLLAEAIRQPLGGIPDQSLRDFLNAHLGALTHSGGTVQLEAVKYTVLQVRRRRAHMVLVEISTPPAAPQPRAPGP